MDKISIIVPCYNEQDTLPLFYEAFDKVSQKMAGQKFELLFINDGSKDDTLTTVKKLGERDERVKYISLSRNFGKEAGIYAGLKHATGDYVAVMDADLQDPPSLLMDMYEEVKKGKYDCVATKRSNRKGEPPIRSFFSSSFYKVINKISDISIVEGARDYRLMSRQMVDAILSMGEYNRFSKGIFSWIGFDIKWIEYTNVERVSGRTKWSLWNLFLYSLEGISAFSTVPLAISSVVGLIFCLIAMVMMCIIIGKTMIYGDPVAGWPSLVCIICTVGGIQLFCIGILGQYISKTYLETKQRPIYIIKDTNIKRQV